MRHSIIKFTNTTSVVLFGLLLVLMPRTTDPDLAPPAPIEFVSASVPAKIWVSKITPVEKPHNTVWRVEFSDGKKVVLWPCVYEDSRHCYWQADTMGNGTGRTFLHARQRYFFVNYYAN